MIHEDKCYTGTCDNCGETFSDFNGRFSMFVDKSSLKEYMEKNEWYTGYPDSEHQDNHYCPNCFKNDPEIDDKIIIDLTRKKEPQ
jgi:hypothetical protein